MQSSLVLPVSQTRSGDIHLVFFHPTCNVCRNFAHQVKSKQVGFAASVPPQHCHSCSKAEVLAAAVQIFRSIFAEQPELPGSHSRCPKHQRCAEAAGELCFCKADPGWLMVSIPNAWSGEKCPAPSPWGCTQQPPRCPGMA